MKTDEEMDVGMSDQLCSYKVVVQHWKAIIPKVSDTYANPFLLTQTHHPPFPKHLVHLQPSFSIPQSS